MDNGVIETTTMIFAYINTYDDTLIRARVKRLGVRVQFIFDEDGTLLVMASKTQSESKNLEVLNELKRIVEVYR
jgi:peroxiredoxin